MSPLVVSLLALITILSTLSLVLAFLVILIDRRRRRYAMIPQIAADVVIFIVCLLFLTGNRPGLELLMCSIGFLMVGAMTLTVYCFLDTLEGLFRQWVHPSTSH